MSNTNGCEPDEFDRTQQAKVYAAAIRLLGGREHTQKEMHEKLSRRFTDAASELIGDVVMGLVEQDLLSDERYVEAKVRGRIAKGYGVYHITQELKAKGIATELIEATIAGNETDWFELARALVERRHQRAHEDGRAWERAVRFLQRRGFPGEIIRHAVGPRPR